MKTKSIFRLKVDIASYVENLPFYNLHLYDKINVNLYNFYYRI